MMNGTLMKRMQRIDTDSYPFLSMIFVCYLKKSK